jgi:hypothetical protein
MRSGGGGGGGAATGAFPRTATGGGGATGAAASRNARRSSSRKISPIFCSNVGPVGLAGAAGGALAQPEAASASTPAIAMRIIELFRLLGVRSASCCRVFEADRIRLVRRRM